MYPIRILSISNGWNNLTLNKANEWYEIERILESITDETLRDEELFNELPDYLRPNPKSLKLYDLTLVWNMFTENVGWAISRVKPRNKGVRSFSVRNVKNGVAAQLFTQDRPGSQDVPSTLLVNIPRAFALNICEAFILLVPTDECAELFKDKSKSSVNRSLTESIVRAQIKDLQFLLTDNPVVIVFFSNQRQDVSVDEITINANGSNEVFIERSIEFAPEYYQAGVSVLSYFGEILRQKYPDANAKVRIEQQGNVVRMHIETPSGNIDTIEKELELYALVIKKQAPVESLLQDRLQIMALENKLEVAQMEIRQAYKMLELSESINSNQRRDYEQEVGFLRLQIGGALQLATQQMTSHERIQIAQIGHTSNLFKDIIGEAHSNQIVLNALRSLEYNLMSGISLIDVQDKIDAALVEVQQKKPTLLTHIAGQIESGVYGAAAGYTLEWIKLHGSNTKL